MNPDTSKSSLKLSKVRHVPLSDIHQDPDRFQPRDFRADGAREGMSAKASREHIVSLKEIIKEHGKVEPLTCWTDPKGKLFVIDGHHRLEAYRRAFRDAPDKKVPVRTLPSDSTANDAYRFALLTNQKDKLNMTAAQKSQAVWQYICKDQQFLSKHSCREAASMFGISKSTISNMRKTLSTLKDRKAVDYYPLWRDACRMNWDNHADTDPDREEQKRQEQIEKLSVELEGVLRAARLGHPQKAEGVITEAISMAVQQALGFEARVKCDLSMVETWYNHQLYDSEGEDY